MYGSERVKYPGGDLACPFIINIGYICHGMGKR